MKRDTNRRFSITVWQRNYDRHSSSFPLRILATHSLIPEDIETFSRAVMRTADIISLSTEDPDAQASLIPSGFSAFIQLVNIITLREFKLYNMLSPLHPLVVFSAHRHSSRYSIRLAHPKSNRTFLWRNIENDLQ